jgi:hypothetical protein
LIYPVHEYLFVSSGLVMTAKSTAVTQPPV